MSDGRGIFGRHPTAPAGVIVATHRADRSRQHGGGSIGRAVRHVTKAVLGLAAALAALTTPAAAAPSAGQVATLLERPLYSAKSPWNTPVPTGAAVDPGSAQMIAGIQNAVKARGLTITRRHWTVPVAFADATTPRVTVELRKAPPSWTDLWGTPADFIAGPPGLGTDSSWRYEPITRAVGFPIPKDAPIDPQEDAHLTVLDLAAGCEYDLYGVSRKGTGWQAVWANSTRTTGTGIYPHGLSSKASGFAGMAGMVWPHELKRGRIDHALFLALPNTRSGGPVAPATATDGKTAGPTAVPMGARLRLDPTLDLDRLRLTPHERTLARALQTYGAFVGDSSGAASFYAVGEQSFAPGAYDGLLPSEDFPLLERLPVGSLQVLAMSAQEPNRPLSLVRSGCGRLR
jgi:hypothetical protein